MRFPWLLWLRRAHLFLGVFFAPLLLLFCVTGWWQTVTPNRNKGLGFGQSWIEKLSTVHVDQYYPAPGRHAYATGNVKFLVVLLSAGLIVSTVLGLVMSFAMTRKKARLAVGLSLAAGIVVPAGLLWLAVKPKPLPKPAPVEAGAPPSP